MIDIYRELEFVYPYQQAIGFYLQHAGYTGPLLSELKKTISPFDFYVEYKIVNKAYDKEWKIYFPKNLI